MVMMSINNSDAFRRRVAILLVFTQGILVAQQTAHAFVPPLLRRAVPVPVTIHETRSRRFSIKPDKEQTEIVNVDTDIERDPIRSFIPFPIDNEIEIKNVDKDEQQKQLGIWAARGLLLLVAMLWGTNFASVKYLETLCFHPPCNHPPSQAAFARFGVAALVSLPLLIGQRKDIILAGFECGLWITLGYITQAMALEFIPSGKCAFICSLTVVTVPLIAYLIGGKPIKSIEVASAIVALTGVGVLEGVVDVNEILGIQPALADTSTVLVSLASTGSTATSGVLGTLAQSIGVSKGDLLALGQPLGFGLSFMRIEHYVEKFKDVPNRVLTISAAQCMAVGLCSLLWLLYDFHGTIPNFTYMLDYHRLIAVGWTGIVTTVVAIYLQGVALGVATATEAALTFASEPVWASLFGAWLLKEQLNATTYVGGSIILLGCLLGSLGSLLEPTKVDPPLEKNE